MIKFLRVPLEEQIKNYSESHQTLDLGDNWEDELREKFKRERWKEREYVPPLSELIDLNYKPKTPLVFTSTILACEYVDELESVIERGVQWARK